MRNLMNLINVAVILGYISFSSFLSGCTSSKRIVVQGWSVDDKIVLSESDFINGRNTIDVNRMVHIDSKVYLTTTDNGYLALTASGSGGQEVYKVELFDQCGVLLNKGEVRFDPGYIPFISIAFRRATKLDSDESRIQWISAIGFIDSRYNNNESWKSYNFNFKDFYIKNLVAYIPVEPIVWDSPDGEKEAYVSGVLYDENPLEYEFQVIDTFFPIIYDR